MDILYVLYKRFWNFIGAVMRHKPHNYNGNIWSKSEYVYKSYKIFISNIYSIKNNILNMWLVLKTAQLYIVAY